MMRIFISIFFLFIVSTSHVIYAQTPVIAKSTTTQRVGNQMCYVHTVKKNETLFSISRAYQVTIEQIQKYNDNLQNGIKVNQLLYIPLNDATSDNTKNANVNLHQSTDSVKKVEPSKEKSTKIVYADSLAYFVHTVEAGQTLYFLSRLYQVSTEQLYAVNLGISEALSIGQIIHIPCVDCKIPEKQEKLPKERKLTKEIVSHVVDSTETVYQIALSYGVPPEVVYNFNPSLLEGEIVGKKIEIPIGKTFLRKEFIYYEIPKNANASQISQQFRISNEELFQYNSRAFKELPEGSFLRVPITNDNRELALENIQLYKDFQFHVVSPKETVYSITKKYGIAEKELYRLNPSVSKHELSIGTLLKVPASSNIEWYVYSDTITRKKISSTSMQVLAHCCDTNFDSSHIYEVVLMLPFFLEKNNSYDENTHIINKQKEIFDQTLPFVEYYEGLLLGIDSLKKKGISITLHVHETNRDSSQIFQILPKINVAKTDLIIGPVFPEMFNLVADFAKNNSIPIVSPLASSDRMVENNSFAIQMNPPERLRYVKVAQKLTQIQKNNIILVYNSVVMEQQHVDECKRVFIEEYADSLKKYNITFTEILFPEHGMKAIEAQLKSDANNVIVFVSKNQAFITNIITQLYRHTKKYSIQVFSFLSWERYENIELNFLFDLHFHYSTSGFTNYQKNDVAAFISKYRDLYKTEPTRFSFQGYDQILYFVESMEKFGQHVLDCMPSYHKQGLHNSFIFIKETEQSGLINNAIDIIEFSEDNTLKIAQ